MQDQQPQDEQPAPDTYAAGETTSPVKGQQTLSGMSFVKDSKTGGNLLSYGKKLGRHPESLWRDDSLMPRALEKGESIFDIIMPWVAEKAEEEKKAAKSK